MSIISDKTIIPILNPIPGTVLNKSKVCLKEEFFITTGAGTWISSHSLIP